MVLKAQELGLNTCWVALTYKKGKAEYNISDGERLYIVIALGYGENQGVEHKKKAAVDVSNVSAKAKLGFYSKIDLGIVQYHFENVSGHKVQ